jgi:hypothetical protein
MEIVYDSLLPLIMPPREVDNTGGDVWAKDLAGILSPIIVDQPESFHIDKKIALNPLSKAGSFILQHGPNGQIKRDTSVLITNGCPSLGSALVRKVVHVIRRKRAKRN